MPTEVPTVGAPGSHAVPDAPAGGTLPSAVGAAPGAAGSGAAGRVPLGLPPPGRTRTAAPAALSTLAAPAGAARPARGRRRGRGPRSTAAAGGPVCATPGPALCRLRAAGRRALLPAGARRAPHGRGTSTHGGASTAGVAAARAAGQGWPLGGVPGHTGLAQRSQTTPPAVILARARDATSTPGAQARATPGGVPAPPPSVSRGGAHSSSGSGMSNQRGELRRPFPLSPPLPAGATGHVGARGVQAPRAPAGRPGGHARVGGVQPRPHPPSLPSRGLADIFGDISRRLTAAGAGSSATGEGADPPPGAANPPPGGGQDQGASVEPHPSLFGGGAPGAEAAVGEPPPPHPPPSGGGQEMSIDCHPPGDGSGGAAAATSATGAEQEPPPGAVTGQQAESLPPSPPQERAQRAGGKRVGQPRRPMQTLCDEHRAPACKSCKGHRGLRHCCSRHHEGHPRVMGGGQRCLPVQRGRLQLQQQAGVLPSGGSAVVPAPMIRGEGGGPAGQRTAALPRGGTQGPGQGHGRASEEGT